MAAAFDPTIWPRVTWSRLALSVDPTATRIPGSAPFEFQRLKAPPLIAATLQGASASAYGRAGHHQGWHSLPRCTFPAVCSSVDAGTPTLPHRGSTPPKSGMVAAATVAMALRGGDEGGRDLASFRTRCCKPGWTGN